MTKQKGRGERIASMPHHSKIMPLDIKETALVIFRAKHWFWPILCAKPGCADIWTRVYRLVLWGQFTSEWVGVRAKPPDGQDLDNIQGSIFDSSINHVCFLQAYFLYRNYTTGLRECKTSTQLNFHLTWLHSISTHGTIRFFCQGYTVFKLNSALSSTHW